MKTAIAEHYDVSSSLSQQLADAIAAEQYELAAQLARPDRARKRAIAAAAIGQLSISTRLSDKCCVCRQLAASMARLLL